MVETDASDTIIAATLNQAGRPEPFFTNSDAHGTQTYIGPKGGLHFNRGNEKSVLNICQGEGYTIVTDEQGLQLCFTLIDWENKKQ